VKVRSKSDPHILLGPVMDRPTTMSQQLRIVDIPVKIARDVTGDDIILGTVDDMLDGAADLVEDTFDVLDM